MKYSDRKLVVTMVFAFLAWFAYAIEPFIR